MPKDIRTPRDELVCGKLDKLQEYVRQVACLSTVGQIGIDMVYLIDDIRHDCERMELKLIQRKQEATRINHEPNTRNQSTD